MKNRPLISFDYAVKTVLRDPANFGIMSGFLTELFRKPVSVQEFMESESNKDSPDDGINRVDMKVRIDNAEIVVVEIQFAREADFLHRTLFGVSKAVTSQHRKGEFYTDIKKIYSVDIIYFCLSENQDYVYRGRTDFTSLHTNESLRLTDVEKRFIGADEIGDIYPEYFLIEVSKFGEQIKTGLDEWIYFLKNDEVKQKVKAEGLEEAKEKLNYLKLDPEKQAEYDRLMNKRSSDMSRMATARMEGKYEGLEEGRKEGREEGEAKLKSEVLKLKSEVLKLKSEVLDLIAKGYDVDQIEKRLRRG